ncbi:MAG: histidine kinase [Alphaproteobacteria bacterium]|nr:histidine kinase [Alphaproteobacteria bacterium]
MKGSTLMGGMLGFTAVFAGTLWYFQNYAYYEVSNPTDYTIPLTLAGQQVNEPILARDFTVLSADTSPLKFRACFTVENSIPMLTETYQVYDGATPLKPPSWFDCFDVGQLTDDLASGAAVAFLSIKNQPKGVDQVVAVYGDGRAFAWRQMNDIFKKPQTLTD